MGVVLTLDETIGFPGTLGPTAQGQSRWGEKERHSARSWFTRDITEGKGGDRTHAMAEVTGLTTLGKERSRKWVRAEPGSVKDAMACMCWWVLGLSG